MEDSSNSGAPLWLPKKDKSGGVFKKTIAQAALRNWDRLRDYAARERIDSSLAADIVESIVKSMSAGRSRSAESPVRNPGPYLFARFTRRIKRLAARERRIEYLGTPRELESCKASQDWEWPLRLQNAIQAEEAIGYMDEQTRRTYLRRMQGFSWKEIAKKQGVTVNTAIKSYSRGLTQVRERMRLKQAESQSEGGGPRTK
jgi:DNA-directed RNA polymerase specialized sigma24 family protein